MHSFIQLSIQRFFCLVFLCGGIITEAHAQLEVWRPQNPPTVAGDINALQMITPTMAYAVGASSSFITVSDSGLNWSVKSNINGKTNLIALSFIDSKIGMTVGSNAALKTTDAGATWKKLNPRGSSPIYNGVLMISSDIAVIVCNLSSILRTTDGGTTWKEYSNEFAIGQLKTIKKIREDLIVVSGELGNFLFSTDSGANWTKVKSEFGNMVNDFVFSDARTAIAVGERGLVLTSADSGQTWALRPWDSTNFTIGTNLLGVDQKQGTTIAIGEWGVILRSVDKGLHWTKCQLPVFLNTNMIFHGISMWDKNYGMIVGDNGFFLRTTDGGLIWTFIPQNPLFTTLQGIAFPKGDTSNGIAVGDGATILRTSDGGKKWLPVTTSVINETTNLNSVCFSDSLTAWACGEEGTVLRSTDFGISWNTVAIPTKGICTSIYFLNSTTGWMTVDFSSVLETKTGGASWHYLRKDTGVLKLGTVSLCDSKHGLAGPYLTSDGGISWTQSYPYPTVATNGDTLLITPPTVSRILSPDRQSYALIVNNIFSGKFWGVLATRIGGKEYFFGDDVTTYGTQFLGMEFADSLHGTAVGINGITCQTTDGGMTWDMQDSRTTTHLFAVSMPLPNIATSSGLRGSIYRRTNKTPIAAVSHIEAASNSPIDIHSIYPNPAREASTLQFQLQQPMPIELRIYDLKGILVQSSDLGLMTAGEYEQSLSFAGLAVGGYIVELRSPEYSKHIILQAGE